MKALIYWVTTVVAVHCASAPSASASENRYNGEFSAPTLFIATRVGSKVAAANHLPEKVRHAVYAANRIIGRPYKWGGGHLKVNDTGYDCSGAVSYILSQSKITPGSMHCREFMHLGRPGPGRWITLWVNSKHIFITICGRTFDVFDEGKKTGPRWLPQGRSTKGFQARHIPGL